MPAEYDQTYTDYQTQRSTLRRLVRQWYMEKARSLVDGKTLDIGCGIGDLLSILPSGSIGLEYNQATVSHCQRHGLPVHWYDGHADNWRLSPALAIGQFKSIVISHVLEHFDNPTEVLSGVLTAAPSLGADKILVIVPGRAGFASDPTHRTMIDLDWIQRTLQALPHWRLTYAKHYPFNNKTAGSYFAHNELQVVLERANPIGGSPIVGG